MAIPAKEKNNEIFNIRSGSEKPGAMELWCQSRPEEAFHTDAYLGVKVLSRFSIESRSVWSRRHTIIMLVVYMG